jgi:pimeloyl-ACP methyl ester carboxylesterase
MAGAAARGTSPLGSVRMIAIDQSGRGEPIVLLHGVGSSRVVWRHVTTLLDRERLVLAPDLPGFGQSRAAAPRFDLQTTAEALAGPLAERAGGPFDLVGNSLGGAVALVMALQHHEWVRRLVLVAPAGFSPRPRALALAAGALTGPAMSARRILGTPIAASPTARRTLLWGAIAEPQRLAADDARMMLRASRGSTRIGPAVTAVLQIDLRAQLSRLEVPLGLIWGERDRVIPVSTLDTIRELRPDLVAETIPGAGHVPQVERPEEFVAALTRLLDRL